MTDHHVSRWRLPSAPLIATTNAIATDESLTSAVSLRYLDEFVRKLQCAPRLLEHQLFPDAKEITESMGLFNAVRRYVITSDSNPTKELNQLSEVADGIVVVGDGNTPRSAAMFAYRLKHWMCYSIDPAMERTDTLPTSTRAQGWRSIENLVVVRNKIENVHITLRRAVVVLVHAHVTLEQALGAIECEELVGVVTMPCCNWYGQQEQLFGKPPSIVYDDFSILSDHRELRVWVDPRGNSIPSTTELSLDQSAAMAKGCVRKVFVADYGVQNHDDIVANGKTKPKKKDVTHVTTLVMELLLAATDNSNSVSPSDISNAVASIATPTQSEQVVVHLEKLLANPLVRVVVLVGDGHPTRNGVVRSLLQRGFTNVFGLQLAQEAAVDDVLVATIVKLEVDSDGLNVSSSTIAQLECIADPVTDSHGQLLYKSIIIDLVHGGTLPLFDCVVDVGFIHRSLRNQPKKTCGKVFEEFVKLTFSLTTPPSPKNNLQLITVSPRKDWRKADFLANERLDLQFSTTPISADTTSTPLYVYACHRSPTTTTTFEGGQVGQQQIPQAEKKTLALQLARALDIDFDCGAEDVHTIAMISLVDAKALVIRPTGLSRRVCVQGIVQHQRRFTTGPSFFSIAPSSGDSSSFRDHLQVSMDPRRLTRWSGEITLDAVFRLLHKRDLVECVGEMTLNAQQQPMLQLDALRLVESEFQAYQ